MFPLLSKLILFLIDPPSPLLLLLLFLGSYLLTLYNCSTLLKKIDLGTGIVDKVIPESVLQNAQGLAIFTVLKAGFLFSGRAGSGLVVAR